jgi:hypothetical protein
MANIIPRIPAIFAPAKIITNISRGCAFTDLEKITGCSSRLSVIWTAVNTVMILWSG